MRQRKRGSDSVARGTDGEVNREVAGDGHSLFTSVAGSPPSCFIPWRVGPICWRRHSRRRLRRVACPECGKVKRERLPWLADNPFYTKRFAFYVGQRCRDSTIKAVQSHEKSVSYHDPWPCSSPGSRLHADKCRVLRSTPGDHRKNHAPRSPAQIRETDTHRAIAACLSASTH